MRRRPEGTDGSDHKYRMVVEDRYQRAADARKRLNTLLMFQAFYHACNFAWSFLPLLDGNGQAPVAYVSFPGGLIAFAVGFNALRAASLKKGALKFYSVLSLALAAIAAFTVYLYRSHVGHKHSHAWIAGKNMALKTGMHEGMSMAAAQGFEALLDILGTLGQAMAALVAHKIVKDASVSKRAN